MLLLTKAKQDALPTTLSCEKGLGKDTSCMRPRHLLANERADIADRKWLMRVQILVLGRLQLLAIFSGEEFHPPRQGGPGKVW